MVGELIDKLNEFYPHSFNAIECKFVSYSRSNNYEIEWTLYTEIDGHESFPTFESLKTYVEGKIASASCIVDEAEKVLLSEEED